MHVEFILAGYLSSLFRFFDCRALLNEMVSAAKLKMVSWETLMRVQFTLMPPSPNTFYLKRLVFF